MPRNTHVQPADVRGAARLAVDATAGLTDLVEAMHARIASLPGRDAAADGRTRGITGLVYKSIRGVTHIVGGSVDALLGLVNATLGSGASGSSSEREAVVAALNGVLGDHLAATGNPLATLMSLRHQAQDLVLDRAALRAALPQATGRVLVLVHGLCMNDGQWQREGHDHGAALAAALGFTPVYLRYNTGLPIAENGRAFAALLQALLAAWPVNVERVVLLTHSMGGLVTRSALAQAMAAGAGWPRRIDDLVFLGTPHHGAPLERAGHGFDLLLGAVPYAGPLARLGRVRSAGITGLRHGHVLDDDTAVPLPPHVRCYAVAARLGEDAGAVQGRLLGDGLVPVASAFGEHADPARRLAFEPGRQWLAQGLNHMQLLSDARVFEQLRSWLAADGPQNGSAPASTGRTP